MKRIKRLGMIMVVGLTLIGCSAEEQVAEVVPPSVEQSCDCYTQTIQINQVNDTIYKSIKVYGQNLGTCGHVVDLVLPDNNPFVTTHHITNCNLH